MNLLISSVGQRNYLMQCFHDALGTTGKLVTVDMNPHAPALALGDVAYVIPACTHPDYLSNLLQICEKEEIKMLFSINDFELPVIAKYGEEFQKRGIFLAISDFVTIDICADKWKSGEFIGKIGLSYPKTFLDIADALADVDLGAITFPLFIKPRWGSASYGIDKVYDREELVWGFNFLQRKLQRSSFKGQQPDESHLALIQECLTGEEYSIDVVNDFMGQTRAVFSIIKMQSREGGATRVVTVFDAELERIGIQLGKSLRHIGILNCDVISTERGIFLIEMNPRFGGDYPFIHEAGVNVPAAYIAWGEGREPDDEIFRMEANVASSKYDGYLRIRRRVDNFSASLDAHKQRLHQI